MQTVTHILLHTSPLLIYFLVGCVLLLESSGIPILNSTLLLFTGALASYGHLQIEYLALVAVTGSVAGSCLAYFIGLRGGRRILLRFARVFRVDGGKVDIVEHWFRRSGAWMIFFSRVLPYVRPFACFPAGIARMSFMRFFFCSLAGSLLWCIALLLVGWDLGKRWTLAIPVIQQYTLPILALVIVLLGVYIVAMRLFQRVMRTRLQTPPESVSEVDESKRDLIEA